MDRTKVDVIEKLPLLTPMKAIKSFLGHTSFYRRFIQDFAMIARPLIMPLEKDVPFDFCKECAKSFSFLME